MLIPLKPSSIYVICCHVLKHIVSTYTMIYVFHITLSGSTGYFLKTCINRSVFVLDTDFVIFEVGPEYLIMILTDFSLQRDIFSFQNVSHTSPRTYSIFLIKKRSLVFWYTKLLSRSWDAPTRLTPKTTTGFDQEPSTSHLNDLSKNHPNVILPSNWSYKFSFSKRFPC